MECTEPMRPTQARGIWPFHFWQRVFRHKFWHLRKWLMRCGQFHHVLSWRQRIERARKKVCFNQPLTIDANFASWELTGCCCWTFPLWMFSSSPSGPPSGMPEIVSVMEIYQPWHGMRYTDVIFGHGHVCWFTGSCGPTSWCWVISWFLSPLIPTGFCRSAMRNTEVSRSRSSRKSLTRCSLLLMLAAPRVPPQLRRPCRRDWILSWCSRNWCTWWSRPG